ncbi:MAG: alpha/beta hydrolase [Proteobacteria bacterium]|nr:MAG: alpha/beta hydrolase [Pseudomonadota bacterium]
MSFLTVDSVPIHYQIISPKAGDDISPKTPTVVFLHGLIMDNLSSWFFTLANPVAQITKVLAYDFRGHGFSERPRKDYSIDRHVEDLKVLIDELNDGEPVILVGNSYGGLVALNFATKYKEKVLGLVLVESQINDQPWKDMMIESFSLEGEERDQRVCDMFQNWLGRASKRKSNRLVDNAKDLLYNTTLMAELRVEPFLADEQLHTITAPCFAIYGSESDILPVAHRLAAVMPNCHLEVVEGATHSVLWEQTDLTKAWIIDSIKTIIEESTPSHYGSVPLQPISLEWEIP